MQVISRTASKLRAQDSERSPWYRRFAGECRINIIIFANIKQKAFTLIPVLRKEADLTTGRCHFIDLLANALEQTGGYTPESRKTTGTLLPDILRYKPARRASIPDNGRALRDDAAATFLAIFTNRKVTSTGSRIY